MEIVKSFIFADKPGMGLDLTTFYGTTSVCASYASRYAHKSLLFLIAKAHRSLQDYK